MPPKAGRIRTESMIDRLGRKPMSEGFELWDKDYTLGALRLFQCKLEVAPPFEVAACLDAVGDILTAIEEPEEAAEHYAQAVTKYKMINKVLLSNLMECKALEVTEGKGRAEARKKLEEIMKPFDERLKEGKSGDELMAECKGQEPALGRLFLYKAELTAEEKPEEALAAVDAAIKLKCDRVHTAHNLRGDLLAILERPEEALEAYKKCVEEKPSFVIAYEAMARVLRGMEGKEEEAIKAIDKSLELHPKATMIRDKSFILSNLGKDQEAIEVLEKALKDPPHEETDTLTTGGISPSTVIICKAKAAILADLGKFEEANNSLNPVFEFDPEDEEAIQMRKDIYITLGTEYLGKHDIPKYLDSLVAKVLQAKPDAPIAFMIEEIQKELASAGK